MKQYQIHWKLAYPPTKLLPRQLNFVTEGYWHCDAMSPKQARWLFRQAHPERVTVTKGAPHFWVDFSRGVLWIESVEERKVEESK